MATIKQMKNRMHEGHTAILKKLATGERWTRDIATPLWVLRGDQKCFSTLREWGAVDSESRITALGRELIGQ
jgi:hypothetical protein